MLIGCKEHSSKSFFQIGRLDVGDGGGGSMEFGLLFSLPLGPPLVADFFKGNF